MSLREDLERMGRDARDAAQGLRTAPSEQRSRAILAVADQLRRRAAKILSANAEDVASATGMLDRLRLDEERLEALAGAVEDVAELPDPVGQVIDRWTRPNGLEITRIRTPIGVIGMIYESR